MTSLSAVRDRLARLVAFDTTSRGSNLSLIDWVEAELAPFASRIVRLPNAAGDKANLWVRIGPDRPGGVVLSGHTDVVPVDGQPWTSDPWSLTERDGRLYGRGASDMKGFIALAMAHAEAFAALDLAEPVHFAFSYDEEIGCRGVLPMIDAIAEAGAAPSAVWVGEPTLWRIVSGHKGIRNYEVRVTGREAHSSDPRKGASAIHAALELLDALRSVAADAGSGPLDAAFDPPWCTLTVGEIAGGTAHNILARECRFVFDFRAVPGADPDAILVPFLSAVSEMDAKLKRFDPACGAIATMRADAPPLRPEQGGSAETLVRRLTGDNAASAAAYCAEAGQFQRRGFSSVICGPGSIDQAHQPDEWIAIAELQRGVDVFAGWITELGKGRG